MDYIADKGLSDTPGDPPSVEQVKICKRWINEFVNKRKTINEDRSSYGLKHKVEMWAEDTSYVSNGAFIKAAVDLGYKYRRIRDTPNAFFNMSFPRRRTKQYKIAFPTE